MKTKISILRELMANEQWDKAISMAAKFPRLGKERDAILRADMAIKNPNFCIQIKKDPQALRLAGIEEIKKKYLS